MGPRLCGEDGSAGDGRLSLVDKYEAPPPPRRKRDPRLGNEDNEGQTVVTTTFPNGAPAFAGEVLARRVQVSRITEGERHTHLGHAGVSTGDVLCAHYVAGFAPSDRAGEGRVAIVFWSSVRCATRFSRPMPRSNRRDVVQRVHPDRDCVGLPFGFLDAEQRPVIQCIAA